MTVDQVFRMVSQFGEGALMWKLDVEAAIGTLRFNPSYRLILSMKWWSKFYVDLAFPFVLLSAHYIFNCV